MEVAMSVAESVVIVRALLDVCKNRQVAASV